MSRKIWTLLGIALIVAALGLTLYNIQESNRAGAASDEILNVMADLLEKNREKTGSTNGRKAGEGTVLPALGVTDPTMSIEVIDGWEYIGVLEVPSQNLSLPVLAEWDYERLQIAPCRYSGSYMTDDLVLCGHNYDSHFNRLRVLGPGDEVLFLTVDGTVFRYEVSSVETLQPSQVEEMTQSDGDWDLTLFTCNTGGQTRCAVRCILEKE